MAKKTAFITGASAGIGEACARVFAREGYDLLLAARRIDRVETLSAKLTAAFGIKVHSLALDVRDVDEVFTSFNNLPEHWRQVDVLVNNAGLSQGLDPIHQGDIGDWDRMIDTNIKGLLYITRAVAPGMVARKQGHIINIGSIAGKEVYPNGNVYCATKHAVDALTKGMRIDLLDKHIKVTAIHPGMVETEFSEVRFKGDTERAAAVYDRIEPLLSEDIAEAVWFAASRPKHVNVNDMLIMPTMQANATTTIRE
ncbi:SDR family oxidoreductase [Parapedobacter sp. 10938]|uniref:SDR family oxidoreductase n=1 Tax=Parapedobacter flavus TaxID=3110225 RepID=UPI002DBF2FF2|nr:SDR family oxidoreductase [Parapedobacter sp. 10938]MEC3878703.1 SDR family oxidoreductase [Parapedobacter sp. 10938]